MKDFFDLLSEFLESDLAKENMWILLVVALGIIVISGYVVWLYLVKIRFPIKINRMEEIQKNNERLMLQVEELKKQNTILQEEKECLEEKVKLIEFNMSIMSDSDVQFEDPAMQRFIKR